MSSLAIAFLFCSCGSAPQAPAVDSTPQALRNFDDTKFGMFIHWGLYALPAGEWKGVRIVTISYDVGWS